MKISFDFRVIEINVIPNAWIYLRNVDGDTLYCASRLKAWFDLPPIERGLLRLTITISDEPTDMSLPVWVHLEPWCGDDRVCFLPVGGDVDDDA